MALDVVIQVNGFVVIDRVLKFEEIGLQEGKKYFLKFATKQSLLGGPNIVSMFLSDNH